MDKTKQTKNFQNTTIPSDWEVKHFGDIADIDKISLKSNTPEDYEFDYISLSDVDSNDFKIETTKQVFANAPSRARRVVSKGDILMSTVRPNLQGFTLIENDVSNLIASTGFAVISTREVLNSYLFQYLFSSAIERQFHQLLVGSNYPAINSSDVKKLKIPLPPLPEQKAIAQVLSTWDHAIQKTEALLAQKELRKKWLMQQLLTGKKRLKGFDGEWRERRIGDITQKISRRNKQLSDASIYSVTNNSGFVLQSNHFAGRVAGDDLSNYKIIKRQEFAYNPARINVGSLAYFEEDLGIISSLYVCFKTKSEILDYFLLQFLRLEHTKHRIISLGEGGVRIYLWYDLFSKIKIKFPSLKEQAAIAQVLQAADKEIELIKAKATQLREQKKGLMQQLLTGKIRMLKN